MQPGQEDELVPRADALEGVEDVRLEVEPGIGCALITLFRGRCGIDQ
jgi:hypothetical protein